MNKYIFALLIGVTFTSFSSIFIRFTPASAIIIAFWRQILATFLTFVLILISKQHSNLFTVSKNQLAYFLVSGLFLALHFATWILSLFYTTIAQSLVIVDASPLFVVLFGVLFLKEHISSRQIIGIAISFFGGIIIAIGSINQGQGLNDTLGIFLAFIGALTFSGYIIIGRFIRKDHDINIFVYTFYVYFSSTIFLFLIALITSTNDLIDSFIGKLSIDAYLGFILLAGVSTILGHSMYNFALKEIKAAIISIVTLGEPIISSILAIILLFEYPSIVTVLGGFIILIGILLTILQDEEKFEIEIE